MDVKIDKSVGENSLSIAVGQPLSEFQAMSLAIAEAYKAAAFVSPNPLVGAVVLDAENKFLAVGHHEVYGGPHAEVNALKGLPLERLKGAKVFVTLEPCAHEGKTPSCAKMLAQLPIAEVIFGLVDPNPLVAGQGAKILEDAGIKATNYSSSFLNTEFDLRDQLEEVCEVFLRNFRDKKIFVAVKVAQSLDGKVALVNNQSKWITSPESRFYGHYLRAVYDATMVGTGTFLADDPSLNVRLPNLEKKNKVVLVDSKASLSLKFKDSKLIQTHHPENIFWLISEDLANHAEILAAKDFVTIVPVKLKSGHVDLEKALAKLFDLGIRSILVEGGPGLVSSFLSEKLLQKLFVFIAPKILGQGKSWSESLQLFDMTEAIELKNRRVLNFGPDILMVANLKR